MLIEPAVLDWINQDGIHIPISRQFGDVYFSRANGLAETRHVFIAVNDLTSRLAQLQDYQYFCVGELGFGTGLNILALWQLWQQVRPHNHSRLHVVSFEKHPLTLHDLIKALAAWPELQALTQQLLAQYPPAIAGCHRLNFKDERFSLDLWLGDAASNLPQVSTKHAIDAWFLDGFAPKCNPQLWQDNILAQVIRLSGPGTTFASFSVAGIIKHGLTQHGMIVKRPKGFGHKREMLTAYWPATPNLSKPHPFNMPKIAIVGAGIAGLSVAQSFTQRGYLVDLIDQQAPLAGASGNPCALVAPKLIQLKNASQNLLQLGSLYSIRYWQQYKQVVEPT